MWVAERRGTSVYSRRGPAGKAGTVKAKPFKTEAQAEAFLASEHQKRLDEGFVMVDPDATLDDPFTLDGTRAEPLAPEFNNKQEYLVEVIRTHTLGGFTPIHKMSAVLDDLCVANKVSGLRAKLDRQLAVERDLARQRPKPEPCVNEAIDRAFAYLGTRDIVALQNAGFTSSDGWEDINTVRAAWRDKGRKAIGGCFYHFQDLERAVKGGGLLLGFSAFEWDQTLREAANLAVGTIIVDVLRAHGVSTTWNGDVGQRIAIDPFAWWRPLV